MLRHLVINDSITLWNRYRTIISLFGCMVVFDTQKELTAKHTNVDTLDQISTEKIQINKHG